MKETLLNAHQSAMAISPNSSVGRFYCLSTSKFLTHLIFIFWGLSHAANAAIGEIEALTLVENTHELTLFANGTCATANEEIIVLADDKNQWNELTSIQSINNLSGLAILEQVKQQVRKTRVVVALDRDNETRLTIKYPQKSHVISLYSVNLLHETYPNAQLLGHFMDIITKMRNSEVSCQK
jgi:hypothetical protein